MVLTNAKIRSNFSRRAQVKMKRTVGAELLRKQVSTGVRGIIEDLDALRIKFGFQNVEVLTPMAESRIRSGYVARIPLKVRIVLSVCPKYNLVMILTFPMGYPHSSALQYEVSLIRADSEANEDEDADILSRICNVCDEYLEVSEAGLDDDEEDVIPELNNIRRDGVAFIDHVAEACKQLLGNSEIHAVEPTSYATSDSYDYDPRHTQHQPAESEEIPGESEVSATYSCMRCRYMLCTSSDLVSHEPPVPSAVHNSSSYFMETMPSWLTVQEGQMSGKLLCPGCNSKLGSWGWAGIGCSCGTWVAPAFHISKSKVDMRQS
jgi:hypothetical protein